MNLTLLILSCLLVLMVGFYFAVKGLKDSSEDDDVVPISDTAELRKLNKMYSREESAKMPEVESVGMQHTQEFPEEEKVPLEEKKDQHSKELDDLKNQLKEQEEEFSLRIQGLQKEKQDLEDALKRELSSRNQTAEDPLPRDDRFGHTSEELQCLQDKNAKLVAENEDLKLKIDDLRSQVTGLIDDSNKIEKLSEQKRVALDRIAEKDRIIEGLGNKIDEISRELETKKLQIEKTESIDNSDIVSLKAQISSREETIKMLESELEELRASSELKIREAEKKISELSSRETEKSEEEELSAKEDPGEMFKEVEELRKCNANLEERENILQYELAKSKAEAIGLEKICKELKESIEKNSA